MAYIESDPAIARDPRTFRLRRLLDVSMPTAVGHLHFVWWWGIEHAPVGEFSLDCLYDLAEAALWEGDPWAFFDALVGSGWVECTDPRQHWRGEARRGDWRFRLIDFHPRRHEPDRVRREWDLLRPVIAPRVYERDGYTCVVCQLGHDARDAEDRERTVVPVLSVDHIVPIARGGSNGFDNLQTLCRWCNSSKGSKTMIEWMHVDRMVSIRGRVNDLAAEGRELGVS